MRATTTKFYEQHLEKIVIGAAGVILLVVLWLFYWQPYEATIDGMPVSSQVLEERVSRELDELNKKNTTETPPGTKFEVPNYAKDFAEAFAADVSPVKQYVGIIGEPGLGNMPNQNAPQAQYAMPEVPVVENVAAISGHYVLGDADPAVMPQLIQLVSADQSPRDFVATSVAGWFDLPKWYKALSDVSVTKVALSDEARRKARLLVDVKLLRQSRDPSTGQWGGSNQGQWKADEWDTIPLLPGALSFRQYTGDKSSLGDAEARALLEDPTNPAALPANQNQISERPFVPITADRPWMPPGLSDADRAAYQQVEKDLADVRQQIRKIEEGGVTGGPPAAAPGAPPYVPAPGARQPVFGPVPGRPGTPPAPNRGAGLETVPGERPGGRGGVPLETVPGERPGGRGGVPLETVPGERAVPIGASNQLEQARARERNLLQKRNKLLGLQDVAAVPAGFDDEAPTQKVRLVAHDLTARPGVTYRYAMVVHVVNPLFQEAGLPQQPMTVASKLSAPSNEVTTESLSRYFLAKVSARDNTANFQIWRVFGGHWQSAEIKNIRSGEEVAGPVTLKFGGNDKTVTVHTGAVLVDVVDDPASEGRAVIMRQDDGALTERLVDRDRDAAKQFGDRATGAAGVASAVGP